MIHLIDNYDSFTHNLAQLFWMESAELVISRNDQVGADEVIAAQPQAIVISPGPGRPQGAGISMDLIAKAAHAKIPVLGICLGHQAIASVFGGDVVYAPALMHGKTSSVSHRGTGLFEGMNSPLIVTRYHSLVVNSTRLPASLEVDATSEDGVIMALRHSRLPIFGLQFHPESFMSEAGPELVRSFLKRCQA